MGVPWAWEEAFPKSLFDLDTSDLREDWGGTGPSLSLSIAESPSLRTIAKFLVETDEAPRSSNHFAGGSSLSGSLCFPPDLKPVPTRGPGSANANGVDGQHPHHSMCLFFWSHPASSHVPIMFHFSAAPWSPSPHPTFPFT